jgi:tight adherence protein B
MRRRLGSSLLFALLAALITAALAGAAASSAPRITEAGNATFPWRAYVLSLPHGMKLRPGQVTVSENGAEIHGLSITPVGASEKRQFGVAMLIDASTSMRGNPEEAAFGAARAFTARRKPNQQIAVVTYNVTPSIALPFTADEASINTALSKQPRFVYGTHIYDAVMRSIDLLKEAHLAPGTIVLLSDGQEARAHQDTASHATEADAAAAARKAHVRVFTVGLPSRLANLGALKQLAQDTGGRYIKASSLASLRSIYNELGSELASEYVIRYQSLAGPGKHITVRAQVEGLASVAKIAYDTPKLPTAQPAAAGPYRTPLSSRVWTNRLTLVLVGFMVAALVGVAAAAVVVGPRQGTVRQRMAEFVSVPSAMRDSNRRPTAQVTRKMLEGTNSLLREATWWQKFRWELEVAAIGMPAEQIVVLSLIGSIVSLAVVKFAFHSTLFALAIAVAIPFGVRAYLKRQLSRRRQQFDEQLPDNLQVLASALRAGHSFIGALSVVVNDAPEPARSEFQRVVADEQLGVPVDQALHVVVERMENRDLEQVSLVAALQHQTGGNTAEVLDQVTDTIRERFELRRTVRTLTAQGRMSRWVLTLLPIFLFLVINLINPGYVGILYHSVGGKVLLVLAGIAVTAGSLVIKRIVNIKV